MHKDSSCKLATRLASDALERPLSMFERLRLRLHLAMCHPCRLSTHEMQMLQNVLKRFQEKDILEQPSLSEADREAIRRSLRKITTGRSSGA
jgi:predicted anti-sigma-YlaC factor YlaD